MMIQLREYRAGMVEVETVTGAVAGSNTRTVSTQNISTSGGTGGFYVGNVHFNDPVRVKSTTEHTTIIEFFLQTGDGKEVPVRLRNIDFPVRDGHIVSVQHASIPGRATTMLSIGNHSTGARAENPQWEWALFDLSPRIGCLTTLGVTVLGILAAAFIADAVSVVSEGLAGIVALLGAVAVPIAVLVWRARSNDTSDQREQMRDDVLSASARQFVDEERRVAVQL